jgi:hypothetical protein
VARSGTFSRVPTPTEVPAIQPATRWLRPAYTSPMAGFTVTADARPWRRRAGSGRKRLHPTSNTRRRDFARCASGFPTAGNRFPWLSGAPDCATNPAVRRDPTRPGPTLDLANVGWAAEAGVGRVRVGTRDVRSLGGQRENPRHRAPVVNWTGGPQLLSVTFNPCKTQCCDESRHSTLTRTCGSAAAAKPRRLNRGVERLAGRRRL